MALRFIWPEWAGRGSIGAFVLNMVAVESFKLNKAVTGAAAPTRAPDLKRDEARGPARRRCSEPSPRRVR